MTFANDSAAPARNRAKRLCTTAFIALGLISVVAACSGTDSNSATPPPSTAPSAAPRAGHGGMTGQISAINGSTWTVHSARGKDITVNLTPQTQFGTKKAPATANQFTVGENVRVAGQRSNGAITAARITQATAAPASSTSPPPSNG